VESTGVLAQWRVLEYWRTAPAPTASQCWYKFTVSTTIWEKIIAKGQLGADSVQEPPETRDEMWYSYYGYEKWLVITGWQYVAVDVDSSSPEFALLFSDFLCNCDFSVESWQKEIYVEYMTNTTFSTTTYRYCKISQESIR